jgi:hypothetical protein
MADSSLPKSHWVIRNTLRSPNDVIPLRALVIHLNTFVRVLANEPVDFYNRPHVAVFCSEASPTRSTTRCLPRQTRSELRGAAPLARNTGQKTHILIHPIEIRSPGVPAALQDRLHDVNLGS